MILPVNENTTLVFNEANHAAALFAVVDTNRPHLSRFLPWVPYMLSVADMERYLVKCENLNREGLDTSFNIFHQGEIVGRIGLSYINRSNKSANIGYWLAEKAQGKGIIINAAKQLLGLGFEQLDLNRIEIKAATTNERSKAIPEKLGFSFEGILREAEWVNNELLDLRLYALLRSDWTKE
ncbi:GNAT family N-acetyltransferase [Niabella hibiscisoli]|uniref:GNAT family N-acetyltransferase n=1 Tax=Niabella hibiscisoli TaxID=1825928 RepID=UPI001F0FFA1E|nr:GNAT family N-acetyltransferase [Niabella hibiscisoli]MCH5715002.1 GNAT family N-acetyltransferase [Niabella hibiscisoli]